MSRLGLFFCAPYVLFIAACFGYVSLGAVGYEAQLLFLQLPISPQLALAAWLGFNRTLEVISWPDAYALFMTPAVILLYSLGALLERGLDWRRGLAAVAD